MTMTIEQKNALRAEAIVAEARQWIGTKWHPQGHVINVGCDCAGLLRGVFWKFDLIPPADSPIGRANLKYCVSQPSSSALLDFCREWLDEIPVGDIRPGDIIAIHTRGFVHHAAIVADGPQRLHMIHSNQRYGVHENGIDEKWRKRIAHAFRVRS